MTYAQQYLPLLEQYAEYLAPDSLYPASQIISVDSIIPTANQTGLAIQSIIGLNAASILIGNDSCAALAKSYANTVYEDGLVLNEARTHFTCNYGNGTTWNVLFPAFSDAVLNLNTFPQSAWDLQSSWYLKHIKEYGLPFAGPRNDLNYTGSPFTWVLTDWNIVAASVSSGAVQKAVIDTTHKFLTDGLNDIPFGTRYNVEGPEAGLWLSNENRAVGGHFALLALEQGTWYTGED